MNEKLLESAKTPRCIIYDYVADNYGWNDAQYWLMDQLTTDYLVRWFFKCLFDGNKDEMFERLGEEDYKTIMDRYKQEL